jgi:DNA-binding XRE family transcriptional regulator
MADVGNVNRQATARALFSAVTTARCIAGLVIQTHRVYESSSRTGKGLQQKDIAKIAKCSNGTVSNLERGTSIPKDPTLQRILKASGFDMVTGHGGDALLKVLQAIRDGQKAVSNIEKELPV